MSKATLHRVLLAAQQCLDSAKLLSSIRPVLHERVSEYEECLDVSLSHLFEVLSALMSEYMSFCEENEYDAEEVGQLPVSYADAVRLLDHFVDEAREGVSGALKSSAFLYRAMEISVRAQTFASLLADREQSGNLGSERI